jgi:ABC-type polysaccharide/polyol phosphate transport system ATPase subunit
VLLIDEVLGVGDASFQAKCSTYMSDYTAQGGTLIVVSHDLEALQKLCVDGIWLHEGRLIEQGSIETTVASYREFIARSIEATGT